MNNQQTRDRYLALSDPHKQIFLAVVSHQLTVHGRAFGLDLNEAEQIKAFRGLNEIQHQISSHIAAIGLGRARYPDEVLWNILNEKASSFGLLVQLNQSLDFAHNRDFWNTSS